MKTNYVIGETYYYEGQKFKLIKIKDCGETYPLILIRESDNEMFTFTLKGALVKGWKPTLSTSPTEFIAPKSTEDIYNDLANEAMERIIKAHGMTEPMLFNCKPIKSCAENKKEIKIEQAIALLKSEGYTITKQY